MRETNGHSRKQSETELQKDGHRGRASLNGNLSYKEKQNPATKALQPRFESLEELDAKRRSLRRRRCFCWCCFSCLGIIVALVIIIVILALTVFKTKNPLTVLKTKDPTMDLNSVTVDGVSIDFDISALKLRVNLTVIADMSVKNQNKVASFKHGESTSVIFYRGVTVGQAVIPAGTLKAERTVRMNVTTTVLVDLFATSLSELLNLLNETISGSLPMTTRTVMAGRVTLLHFIKKHVTAYVECIISVNVKNSTATTEQCEESY